MPSLMLRALSADLIDRIRAYARGRNWSLPAAAVDLLEGGLERRQSQRAGAMAVNAKSTPEERSERARAAVKARWASGSRTPASEPAP